ncbi:hypothetical protein [Consotaella aegiceratis]|uniref:hypothetical protein n=1 Tax=Consotaella aegiceratis TaxID=3097961 RepID=UPI002F401481
MKTFLIAVTALGAMAAPALAQQAGDVDCATFTAMDADGRMAAVESMQGSMSGDGMMADHDTMASDDAMKSDDGMASGEMMEGAGAMESDGMMAGGDMVAQATKACADHPDMTVADAMHAGSM